MCAVMTVPFITVSAILATPPEFRWLGTVLIIVGWGFASGYKDWAISKRKEEEVKPYSVETASETLR